MICVDLFLTRGVNRRRLAPYPSQCLAPEETRLASLKALMGCCKHKQITQKLSASLLNRDFYTFLESIIYWLPDLAKQSRVNFPGQTNFQAVSQFVNKQKVRDWSNKKSFQFQSIRLRSEREPFVTNLCADYSRVKLRAQLFTGSIWNQLKLPERPGSSREWNLFSRSILNAQNNYLLNTNKGSDENIISITHTNTLSELGCFYFLVWYYFRFIFARHETICTTLLHAARK